MSLQNLFNEYSIFSCFKSFLYGCDFVSLGLTCKHFFDFVKDVYFPSFGDMNRIAFTDALLFSNKILHDGFFSVFDTDNQHHSKVFFYLHFAICFFFHDGTQFQVAIRSTYSNIVLTWTLYTNAHEIIVNLGDHSHILNTGNHKLMLFEFSSKQRYSTADMGKYALIIDFTDLMNIDSYLYRLTFCGEYQICRFDQSKNHSHTDFYMKNHKFDDKLLEGKTLVTLWTFFCSEFYQSSTKELYKLNTKLPHPNHQIMYESTSTFSSAFMLSDRFFIVETKKNFFETIDLNDVSQETRFNFQANFQDVSCLQKNILYFFDAHEPKLNLIDVERKMRIVLQLEIKNHDIHSLILIPGDNRKLYIFLIKLKKFVVVPFNF